MCACLWMWAGWAPASETNWVRGLRGTSPPSSSATCVCPVGCTQFRKKIKKVFGYPELLSPSPRQASWGTEPLCSWPCHRTAAGPENSRGVFPAALLHRRETKPQICRSFQKVHIGGSDCIGRNPLLPNGCPKIKAESRAGQVRMGRSFTKLTGSRHYSKTQAWSEEGILGLASASFSSCLGTSHYTSEVGRGE